MTRILMRGITQQDFSISLGSGFQLTLLEPAVAQVIKCLRFYVFTIDFLKGFGRLRISTSPVLGDTAPVVICELSSGFLVFALFEQLGRLLLAIIKQAGLTRLNNEQRAKQ